METEKSIMPMLLLGLQIVGMFGLYFYYTYKNKKAEKAYWRKAGRM